MDWADPESAKKYGIKLLHIPHYSTTSVAEFALTTLLMLVKQLHTVFNESNPAEVKPIKNDTVKGKTIGIVGLGSIGTRMAEICQGVGMNVVAYNRTEKDLPSVKMLSLEDVCSQSDFISINLKNTEETKEIITDDLMQSMKKGVVIVNQASNYLIDTKAMVNHVKAGHIAGYSATSEGIEAEKVRELPQIMLLPAQAWFTDDSLNNLKEIWIDNILQAMEGNIQNLAY